MRFDPDAVDRDGAARYLAERATQALIDGFTPISDALEPLVHDGVEWGLRGRARSPDGAAFQTLYVYAGERGRGHFQRHLAEHREPIATVPDCHLEAWLRRRGVAHRVIARETDDAEYRAIEAAYSDGRARRSQVPLMHHIDEGLAVLRRIGASPQAGRAFCLHPLVQTDAALAANAHRVAALTPEPRVLALALEYRNIANATLSQRPIAGPEDIPLSPLAEVQQMLVADKVQNYKDFVLHHGRTHPRRHALDRYFALWLARLGVGADDLAAHFVALQATANPVSEADARARADLPPRPEL